MATVFRKGHEKFEVVTFEELVEHGLLHGANVVNGMPWGFAYRFHRVTHENDDLYILTSRDGKETLRFNRGEILVADKDALLILDKATFDSQYTKVDQWEEDRKYAERIRNQTYSAAEAST